MKVFRFSGWVTGKQITFKSSRASHRKHYRLDNFFHHVGNLSVKSDSLESFR